MAPAAAPNAMRSAPVPKARPSLGGAAAKAPSPRKDKGKANALSDQNAPANLQRAAVGQSRASDVSSSQSAGPVRVQSGQRGAGAGPSKAQPLPLEEVQKFYSFSHQGSKRKCDLAEPLGDRREKRVRWSVREIAALEESVHLYISKSGGPAWAAIRCARDRDFHRSRTPVDLKDKWRNLQLAKERQGIWGDYVPAPSSAPVSAVPPISAPVASPSAQQAPQSPRPINNSIHSRSHVVGRKRVPWSPAEVALLKKGVEDYGPKWTTILTSVNGFNETRTTMDLKDKWRNVCKSQGAGAQ